MTTMTIYTEIQCEISHVDSLLNSLYWSWTPTQAVIREAGHYSRRHHEAVMAADSSAKLEASAKISDINRTIDRAARRARRARAHKAEILAELTACMQRAEQMSGTLRRIAPDMRTSLKCARAALRETSDRLAR